MEKGDPAAVDDLTKAAALTDQSDAQVLHWLAAALHQAGRLDEALAAQRRAVELRPGDSELTEQLALLEKARG